MIHCYKLQAVGKYQVLSVLRWGFASVAVCVSAAGGVCR